MKTIHTVFIGLSLLLMYACNGSNADVSVFVSTPCEIHSGGTIPVAIRGPVDREAKIEWITSEGEFREIDKPATQYIAPIVDSLTSVTIQVAIDEVNSEPISCDILPSDVTTEQNLSTQEIVIVNPTETLVPSPMPLTPTITLTPTPMATQSQTPTAVPISPAHTPGAVSAAESIGQCGSVAFSNNLSTTNPIFTRPANYTSGWISSDAATVILPDGTSRMFPSQFVLFVDNLAYIELKGVSQNATGTANTWGCWFQDANSNLAADGAAIEYQKKVARGQVSEIYRTSVTGFFPFDTDTELTTIYRTVPSILVNGIVWCTNNVQTVSIAYEGGAYSGWPSDDQCPEDGCWRTSVFVFLNQEVDWVDNQGAEEPGNEVLRVGWDWPALPTEAEAVSRSRLTSPGRLTLESGDCLRFVVQDGRQSYSDNRGDVTISIAPIQP